MLSPAGRVLRALVAVGGTLRRLVVQALGEFLWPLDRKLLKQSKQQRELSKEEEDSVMQSRSTAARNAQVMPMGLVNKGNTCFISSILQCMRVCSDFWVRLEQDLMAIAKHKSGEQVEERFAQQFQVVLTLLRLMQNLVKPHDGIEGYIHDNEASQAMRAEFLAARHRNANSERAQLFLDALSDCTPIISKVSSLQEQQDAEVCTNAP